MPVETGTFVKPGDLIVQLDTRDTRNSYAQARADLDAASVNLRVAKQARDRSEQLYKERIITAVEREAAQVQYAMRSHRTAKSGGARSQSAKSRGGNRARSRGWNSHRETCGARTGHRVGDEWTERGTTIIKWPSYESASAPLVNETDIGKIRPGLAAMVTVDAFPIVRSSDGGEDRAAGDDTASVTMFPCSSVSTIKRGL